MATREEFLEELDGQTREMQAALEQVTTTVASNNAAIADLQSRRKALIHERVLNLLPDLSAPVLAVLAIKLPGFITAEQVEQTLAATRATYQSQLDRLRAEFDPAKFEAEKVRIDVDLIEIEPDQKQIQEQLDECRAIPNLTRLIAARYGTEWYGVGWWQRQYYRDWKAADLAVAAARKKNWKELAEGYDDLVRTAAVINDRIAGLNAKKADLESKKASHRDLNEALAKVPETVLEQLRVKLEARLESMDPAPEWMSGVGVLSGQLLEMQGGNLKLQSARTKMTEQIGNLQRVRTQASRSKKREVPDDYVRNLRSKRVGSFGGGGSVFNRTAVQNYSCYDDFFFDLMLFEQMTGYFDQRDAYADGYQAGASAADQREQTFASARADVSGQS